MLTKDVGVSLSVQFDGLILELGWLIWYASLDGPNDWGDEIYVIDKIVIDLLSYVCVWV